MQEVTPEWQMAFQGDAVTLDVGDAVALTAADWLAMRALAERGGAHALEQNALDKGPYYGVWRDGALVSMAGTHLALDCVRPILQDRCFLCKNFLSSEQALFGSDLFGIGEIGNVVTDPDCRRRGYASLAVAATTRALRAQGLQVILHVYQSNTGAIACYERLGFERTREMYLVRFVVDQPGLGPWRLGQIADN
ncbi:MAG: GNAT family N-acetyltransferase [Anaerolineae bacterium]|nr:GNAT family N-acetyltransferase [Anaerolineae bacterium]